MEIEEISVGEFVSRLFELKLVRTQTNSPRQFAAAEDILRYGHYRGWLEDQDERHPGTLLNRQTAARIAHMFLLIECGLPDLSDITPATVLKDLYTCRVCANHIAQIYTRGIIKSWNEDENFNLQNKKESDSSDSSELFFNHLAQVSKPEALEIIRKLEQIL